MATTSLPMASTRSITITPQVMALLRLSSPVAIGVSGGKDSSAVAIATNTYLDQVGHNGPRVLIHADLGATEWADSLPTCQRLAKHLDLELLVVRRPQGDMMDRWEQRWRDNVARWESLSCVKLILPWSTPSMRFCTSELKVDQICRALTKRWPGQTIINVTGIRREESTDRAKAPIAEPQKKLTSKTRNTTGIAWHPILDWLETDVYAYADEQGFPLHEAYGTFGTSRVSCVWCILATEKDHKAGAKDTRNHVLGRRMVDLEIASTFAFQGNRWLGDTIAPILRPDQRRGLEFAKELGRRRAQTEADIPKHLLYTKGWPTYCPTPAEASLLARVRADVADTVGLKATFTHPDEIIVRYKQLLDEKNAKSLRTRPVRSAP